MASGFCSGMARTSGMCGAVTGGILALNLEFGRESESDSVEDNYSAVARLIAEFEERFGSSNCTKLLGCDLGTKEGQEKFKKESLFDRCREFTGEAAKMTAGIMEEK